MGMRNWLDDSLQGEMMTRSVHQGSVLAPVCLVSAPRTQPVGARAGLEAWDTSDQAEWGSWSLHRDLDKLLTMGQMWICWSRSRGGPQKWSEAGAPLLGGKAGRAGVVHPGEEKALGRPHCTFQCLQRACKDNGDRLLKRVCGDRTREILHKEGRETLAWVAQRGGGCPIPKSTQGQLGRGPE